MRRTLLSFAFLLPVVFVGCSDAPPAPPAPTPTQPKEDDGDESGHDRANMMTIHLGKRHAWLTARLSAKDGNALELFLEKALPHTTIKAKARRTDGKEIDVVFEQAPIAERAKDGPGLCSHYVAKAPWMMPADDLTILADIDVAGKVYKAKWDEFIPKDYTHKKD